MGTEEEARREAERVAADERLGKLAELIGGNVSARAVFGDPVERDGVTVIPVARIRYGFGAGSGRGGGRRKHWRGDGGEGDQGAEDQYGSGGGGGMQAAPIGYIELRGGEASFTRIADPARILALFIPLSGMALGALLLLMIRERLQQRG